MDVYVLIDVLLIEELDGPAVSAISVRSWKLSNARKG
jgi:hypothetical protein